MMPSRLAGYMNLAALFAFTAAAQDVRIAPGGANQVQAIVEKTGLLSGKKHTIEWDRFEGRIAGSPPAVQFTVEAASARVLDDWINEGKKKDVLDETVGRNVLDASRFPQIRFASTSVSGDIGGVFEVRGQLTVRGIAKEVVLNVRRTADKRYEGETTFPMSGFGIKPPKAALGAIGTKDTMTIRFTVSGTVPTP